MHTRGSGDFFSRAAADRAPQNRDGRLSFIARDYHLGVNGL